MAKHLIVRVGDEVEHFHGNYLEGTLDEGVLYIHEKKEHTNLGIFKTWDYVRVEDQFRR